MKAIQFTEVTHQIGKDQPEYEVLPAWVRDDKESKGFFRRVTVCFELDEEERKQVAETGHVFLTTLQLQDKAYNPIMMSTLKPKE